MSTECNFKDYGFQALGRRSVVANFSDGKITSEGGGLLLREVEERRRIIGRFAECFTDYRDARTVEHTKEELIAQRVYAMALGYEDLNDHDNLRHDPMLAVLVGKEDPSGESRARERDRGKALAGKSTLNRLELNKGKLEENERYKKIVLDEKAAEKIFVEVFLDAYEEAPKRIVLDLDATDDLIHGKQEGRFFHGYYGNYCYLPLYIFAGEHLLVAKLRKSDIDGSAGSVEELERVIGQIRERWPAVEIVVRGDSGFCRDELMAWCESKKVDYLFGLAKNARLKKEIEEEMGGGESGIREDWKRGETVQGFSIQDAGELEL